MAAPDLLDQLGLRITEIGAVQFGVERAPMFWPSGEARAVLVMQAAWSGAVVAELELEAGAQRFSLRVNFTEGEVRRVRLPLSLPGGVMPAVLRVRAPIPANAARIRSAWLKQAISDAPAESTSAIGALFGAVKHALGKSEKRGEARAAEQGEMQIAFEPVGGDAPVAAQVEIVWQPGMPEPDQFAPLRTDELELPQAPRRADASGERPECPSCFARAYPEQVRAQQNRCPSCDADWII